MSLRIFLRADLDSECEVGELVGTIGSDSLYVMELELVLLEGVIVRNIYWLGLLCDL